MICILRLGWHVWVSPGNSIQKIEKSEKCIIWATGSGSFLGVRGDFLHYGNRPEQGIMIEGYNRDMVEGSNNIRETLLIISPSNQGRAALRGCKSLEQHKRASGPESRIRVKSFQICIHENELHRGFEREIREWLSQTF